MLKYNLKHQMKLFKKINGAGSRDAFIKNETNEK